MRCPSCSDEYEDHVSTCADCGVPLVDDDTPVPAPVPGVDARLGSFHPVMASRVVALLERRGVAYVVHPTDSGVEVLVERGWRDDLRAELTMSWGELVGRLDEDAAVQVLAAGGSAPGWYDPPRGGHVDRAGRLVVDVDDDEESETDAARMIGPALLVVGLLLLVGGWYLIDSSAIAVAGIGLVLLGLFSPR